MIYGINAHIPTRDEIRLASSRWDAIRIDFVWSLFNPAKGRFDFDAFDRVIDQIPRDKLIIAGIGGTPGWASSDGTEQGVPYDVEYWSEAVHVAATRYPRIQHWGVWNEANLKRDFWHGTMDEWFEKVLYPASNALKYLGKTVLAGDFATSGGADWYNWLEKARKHKDLFDILSIHCYADDARSLLRRFSHGKGVWPLNHLIPDWRAIQPLLDRIGKPVWLTETGWRTDKLSEQEQADNVAYLTAKADYGKTPFDLICWYELRDDPDWQKWGFYKSDLTPKKVVA